MMRSRSGIVVVGMLLALVQFLACAPATADRKTDDWERSPSALSGDLDAAEMRWRKEIEASRAEENRLLTDDPAKPPSTYGKVAFTEEVEEEPPRPLTRWERFNEGLKHFGRATFAAMTVIVTLGMIAAPYLIPAV